MAHDVPLENAQLARATVRGTVWTYLSYYAGKGMVFASTIVLARLLTKEDFGVAGYALTVIALLDVLSDLGIGSALIYHRDDPSAANTAFWLGLAIGAVLFGLTWVLAPLVGALFNDDRAIPVTRALALTFPISAFGNVHDMLLRKRLRFGKKLIPDFAHAVGKGLLSIAFALSGMGAWSLIWGQVSGSVIAAMAYWFVLDWRPTLHWSAAHARRLLGYGLSIVSINTLNIIISNMDYLLIGRYLGAGSLGVYTLAFRVPELIVLQFCGMISRVVFPVFTKMQNDADALRQGFMVSTRYITLVTMPLALGIALVAEPFILTIYSDKWADAIPVIRAIALFTLFYSFGYSAGDVYKAQGRPGILTWLNVLTGVILIPALYIAVTSTRTIAAVGWTHAAVAALTALIDLVVAMRVIHISRGELWDTFRPAIFASAWMVPSVWVVLMLTSTFASWAQLMAAILVGGIVYASALWLSQRNLMIQAGQTIRAAFARR